MKKRKPKDTSGDLTVAVVMTVHADPGQANMGTYSVDFEVDGPEQVVDIVKAAYALGSLKGGIDAFIRSVARSIGPKPGTVAIGKVGRA